MFRVGTVKLSYQLLGVLHVLGIKPLIVRIRVSLPFYQILFLLPVPVGMFIQYLLHFVLFFFSHEVRGRLVVIRTVELHLPIRGKKANMKHVVYLPLFWKCQLIVYGR